MFSHSRNVLLNEGMKILQEHAVTGAVHNSDERFPPPQCHPKTRLAVQNKILAWFHYPSSPCRTMWMRGPAGGGKSAIAQTIAQILAEQDRLSSSFFFNRASANGRSDHKRLVATLSYQMSKHISETRPFISASILADRLVFDMSLESQLEALIVRPLSSLSDEIEDEQPTRLIIVEGLDECSDKDESQAHIVDFLVSALSRIQHRFPHRLLITSRPEYNIEEAFNTHHVSSVTSQLHLDDTWQPDDDIRAFLVDSFAEIRRSRPLFRSRDIHWPSKNDIEHLLWKSSGQFIYASIIVKYIQSSRHDPMERLDVILEVVLDPRNRPYAELDAVYVHLFSRLENPHDMLRFLRFSFVLSNLRIHSIDACSIGAVCDILDLHEGKMKLALIDLSSIITVDDDKIILHAPLPDFLLEEERSGQYYANSEQICLNSARCCLHFLSEINGDKKYRPWESVALSLAGLLDFTENVLQESSMAIYEAISNVNILAALGHRYSASSDLDKHRSFPFFKDIGLFIDSIVAWHNELLLTTQMYSPLDKAVMQAKSWLISCFQAFPFSGFDNPEGIDLWIYAHTGASLHFDKEFVTIIHTLHPPIDVEKVKKLFQVPSVQFCWCIIKAVSFRFGLPKAFRDPNFLGQYCMSTQRCTQAALLHCRNLVWAPESFYVFREDSWQTNATSGLLSKQAPNREIYDLLKPIVTFNVAEGYDEDRIFVSLRLPGQAQAYSYMWHQFPYRYFNKWQHLNHCTAFSDLARSIVRYIKAASVTYRQSFPEIDREEVADNEDSKSSSKDGRINISDEGFETAEEDEPVEGEHPDTEA